MKIGIKKPNFHHQEFPSQCYACDGRFERGMVWLGAKLTLKLRCNPFVSTQSTSENGHTLAHLSTHTHTNIQP